MKHFYQPYLSKPIIVSVSKLSPDPVNSPKNLLQLLTENTLNYNKFTQRKKHRKSHTFDTQIYLGKPQLGKNQQTMILLMIKSWAPFLGKWSTKELQNSNLPRLSNLKVSPSILLVGCYLPYCPFVPFPLTLSLHLHTWLKVLQPLNEILLTLCDCVCLLISLGSHL